MELDAYECDMLDTLLETLAGIGSLTTKQLLNIFDGDEDLIFSVTDELICEGMVSEAGYAQGSKLPLLLNLERKGIIFLESGGFTARYKSVTPIHIKDEKPQAKKLRLIFWVLLSAILITLLFVYLNN